MSLKQDKDVLWTSSPSIYTCGQNKLTILTGSLVLLEIPHKRLNLNILKMPFRRSKDIAFKG